ncbi:hypothetical protein EV363DRAFT_1453387 [Boletus edulis]|nr:hypothetical protein EV363DRAFT_1453387 [Boletus edulis]
MSDSECLYAETEYQESQYARSDEDSEAEIEGIAGEPDGELKSSEGPPGSPPGLPQAGSSKAELSKPSNPPQSGPGQGGRAKVPESALKILRERFPDWKNSDKEERKKHWRAITEAVRALPDHKTMSKQEWQASLRIYLAWMHQQGRAGREKKMKLGHQWTARSVVREEHKERLKEIILEKYGAAPGSVEMLGLYQTELNELIDELSEETWLEASRTAEEWNTQGPAPDVQASPRICEEFAVEMWKKGGIRMVILSGFKDEKGEIFAQVHDFNDEIADGPSFENAEEVQGSFDRYLSKCFDPPKDGDQGAEEDGDREKKQVGKPKKSQGRRRDDVVEKVLLPDGTVWIPEVQNLSRADLQDLYVLLPVHLVIAGVDYPYRNSDPKAKGYRSLQKTWPTECHPIRMTDIFPESGIFLTILVISNARKPFISWSSFGTDRLCFPTIFLSFNVGWTEVKVHILRRPQMMMKRHLLPIADLLGVDPKGKGAEALGTEIPLMMAPRMLEKRSMSWKKTQRPLTNWRPEPEGGEGNGRRLDLHSDEREGNRRREPTPPPERRDLRAELDNVNDARTKYGPPRNVARRRKANWEKGVDKEGIQYLFLIAETKGLNRPIMPESSMARRGTFQRRKSEGQGREPTPPPDRHDLRAGLDHTDDSPNQVWPAEEGSEGERPNGRRVSARKGADTSS